MNDEVEAGPMCTGDCDDDSDCDAGLLCYQRDFYYNTPPGCRPQVHKDECEQPINECDVVDKGTTQTNFVGWTPSISLTIKKSKFMT